MAGARKTFRPPLWGTIGLIISVGVCIAAGFWQMGRADQKHQLMAAYAAGSDGVTLSRLVDDEVAVEFRYRRFSVRGRYDAAHQVLLDNMVDDGRIGYQVLTPFRTGTEAVLVNRGWMPANPDRSILPDISVDDNQRQITGRLNHLPRPGLKLDTKESAFEPVWPRRLLFPTAEELIDQIGYAVYDYQLLLDPDSGNGFERDWSPDWMPAEKHTAYAVQWFALAFTLMVIYFMVNRKVPVVPDSDG